MRIDKEVEKIMNDQMIRARELLTKYKPVLDAIAVELMRVESIEREEFEKILALHGIKAKRKAKEEVYVAPKVDTVAEVVIPETDTPVIDESSHLAANPAPKPEVTVTSEVVVSDSGSEHQKHGKKKK